MAVVSPVGEISIKARITGETGNGFVVKDFGWGNAWDGGPNVNVLNSDCLCCSLSGATPNRCFRYEVEKSILQEQGNP
ncbi:hypothetical protein ACFL0M_08685 [Thermodesulfobacteriota bacterium]